jgi:hypothetical protein
MNKGQATERRVDLEREASGPPSAPQGVGSTKPPVDGANGAYDHIASSNMKPPLPFRPSRTLKR